MEIPGDPLSALLSFLSKWLSKYTINFPSDITRSYGDLSLWEWKWVEVIEDKFIIICFK